MEPTFSVEPFPYSAIPMKQQFSGSTDDFYRFKLAVSLIGSKRLTLA